MKLKKNDIVQVMTGKYKGQKGRIIKVLLDKNRIIVEGINIIKKHEKATKEKKGGIISKENFIHMSNLKSLNKIEATKSKGKAK